MNKFIAKLEKRDKNLKKKKRISSTPSSSTIPENAPNWAVTSLSPPTPDNLSSEATSVTGLDNVSEISGVH